MPDSPNTTALPERTLPSDGVAFTLAEHALRALNLVAEAERLRMYAAQHELALAIAMLQHTLDGELAAIDALDEAESPFEDLEPEDEAPPPCSGPWRLGELHDPTDADGEDEGDAEPSLGSVHSCARAEHYGQLGWAGGSCDDREDEHDGGEPDEADLEEDHRRFPTPPEWRAKRNASGMPLPGGYEPVGF